MRTASGVKYNAMSDDRLTEIVGKFVRHHRLERNMSQEALATAAGLSRPTVSLIERGKTQNMNSLIKVLRVLDVLYVFEGFEVPRILSPLQMLKMEEERRKRARKRI